MRSKTHWLLAAALLLGASQPAGSVTLGKKFDAGKHKQVDSPVKPNQFNPFFMSWVGGPTEGKNNSLWCIAKAHAKSGPRSKVKLSIQADIQRTGTNEAMKLRSQKGKTDATGRVEFYWELDDIAPDGFYFITTQTTFKGKKIDGMWLDCFFGHNDPEPYPLTLGEFDRFGFRVGGGTAFRDSEQRGGFQFPDGSMLLIELENSSDAFDSSIFCPGPTFQYSYDVAPTAQSRNSRIFLRDDVPGIQDMEIFTDGFESGDTAAWSCSQP